MSADIKMYISIGVVCPDNILFMFPNREKPIKAKRIKKKYPEFAKEFDGSSEECCLSYYYKLNRAEGLFEFKDPEAEDEVAEMLGVDLFTGEAYDEDSKGSNASKLSEKDVEDVRAYIADIRNGLKVMAERE